MSYSNQDLADIRTAERMQYERLVAALVQSRALQIAAGHAIPDDMQTCPEWADQPATIALNVWRAKFCPDKVDLPVGPAWFSQGQDQAVPV